MATFNASFVPFGSPNRHRYIHVIGSAVFIDDRADNVAAAQHFGLPAILFTDPQRLRAQLRALGLPLRAVS